MLRIDLMPSAQGSLIEYIDVLLDGGYWDDIEEPADHLDGIYLEPDEWLGAATFGANYAFAAPLIHAERTGHALGWSWLFGVGGGLGVVTGELKQCIEKYENTLLFVHRLAFCSADGRPLLSLGVHPRRASVPADGSGAPYSSFLGSERRRRVLERDSYTGEWRASAQHATSRTLMREGTLLWG